MEEEKKQEEQPVEPEPPPPPQPGPPPPTPPPGDTNTLIILGWVFVGLSLLTCCCCSYVFGPIAAILGGIAYSRGDQRGLWVLIAGIVVFLLGGGFLAASRVYHWPQPWQRGFPNIPGPWRRA